MALNSYDKSQDAAARLRITSGPSQGRIIELGEGRSVIGRSRSCEITIRDLSVSRHHAEIERSPVAGWRLRDAGSRNGISVEGRGGSGWHQLHDGSVIAVGDVEMVFECRFDEAATDPAVTSLDAASRRSDDPPSLPDFEPPKPKVSPAPWRQGVKTASAEQPVEEQPSSPPYLIAAGIGLGLALCLAVVVMVLTPGSEPEEQSDPVTADRPQPDPTRMAAANALVVNGEDAAREERWEDLEAACKEALELAPEHTEARDLLELAVLERRSLTEITAAEEAFEAGDDQQATFLAENVHAQSRYRGRADDLLGRLEERASVEEARPETKVERPRPRAKRPAARRTARRSRPAPARRASQQNSEPDPILLEAKRVFARGRVSDARAAAEAAADAGVAGAAELARRLNAFHGSESSGEEAQSRGETRMALAFLTEAHAVAKQISPPNGGAPGGRLTRRLADLHYQAAREALQDEDPSAARGHLQRALRLQPNHSRAEALLERI